MLILYNKDTRHQQAPPPTGTPSPTGRGNDTGPKQAQHRPLEPPHPLDVTQTQDIHWPTTPTGTPSPTGRGTDTGSTLGHHHPLEPPHPLDVAAAVLVPVSEILQTNNHPCPWNISCRRPPIYHLATKSRPRLLLWRGEEISGICNVHISVVFPSNGQQ